jgi:hypothetical protein
MAARRESKGFFEVSLANVSGCDVTVVVNLEKGKRKLELQRLEFSL